MDLSKAFDCLPHGLLISKLHAYGLSIPACDLIASYLSDRYQRVKLADSRSDWKLLTKGVPQGSILGPLFFNVFMNDLFYFIEQCLLYNYADDNSLKKSAYTIEQVLRGLSNDISITITWFGDNGMQANPTKFQFQVYSSNDIGPISITIDENTTLQSEQAVKVLGVTIDSKLRFTEHVSNCCKKAARQLNALARISRHLNPLSKKIIYNSFVLSNFNYCPLVWHFCGKVNNGKLEKIQERALRILYKDYESSYEELISEAGTTNLLTSRIKKICLEVLKSLHGTTPPCVSNMFQPKEQNYSLRNKIPIIQPRRNTTTNGLRTISYIGAKLWNELPINVENPDDLSVHAFKVFLDIYQWPDFLTSAYPYV